MHARQWAVFAGLVGLCGCFHTDLRRNAPGHVDVHQPPRKIARREVEDPADPGEHRLTLSYGALVAAGASVRRGREDATGAASSLELSLHYGAMSHSHGHDDLIEPYPFDAWGLNLGYRMQRAGDGIELSAGGPFYLEAQYSYLGWIAAGWQADFERSVHGPQLTAGFGPLYVRGARLFGFGTQLEAGIVLKGYHTWIWSR